MSFNQEKFKEGLIAYSEEFLQKLIWFQDMEKRKATAHSRRKSMLLVLTLPTTVGGYLNFCILGSIRNILHTPPIPARKN